MTKTQAIATTLKEKTWFRPNWTRGKWNPDYLIGDPLDPYLRRWWILPRNPWFNIYLHNIRKSDDDRALHDHMYLNLSVLLRGGYIEVTEPEGPTGPSLLTPFKAPTLIARKGSKAHRLIIEEGNTAWTLFITGPRYREWGFHCPQGWRHWRDFVGEDPGTVGRGCGET